MEQAEKPGRKSRRYADIEHLLPTEHQMVTINQLPDAPKKGTGRRPGKEWLFACRQRGVYIAEHFPERTKVGRPRTNFTKAEIEEDAMKRMLPRALEVLQSQLDHIDPKVAQAAAIKVVEYNKGKPTQNINANVDNVNRIVYESAAWRPLAEAGEIVEAVEPIELPPIDDVA